MSQFAPNLLSQLFTWGGKWLISNLDSAELEGPSKLSRIRPEIFDFEPDLGLKLGQTKPKISGTVPDSGLISSCFDDDPKLGCSHLDP